MKKKMISAGAVLSLLISQPLYCAEGQAKSVENLSKITTSLEGPDYWYSYPNVFDFLTSVLSNLKGMEKSGPPSATSALNEHYVMTWLRCFLAYKSLLACSKSHTSEELDKASPDPRIPGANAKSVTALLAETEDFFAAKKLNEERITQLTVLIRASNINEAYRLLGH